MRTVLSFCCDKRGECVKVRSVNYLKGFLWEHLYESFERVSERKCLLVPFRGEKSEKAFCGKYLSIRVPNNSILSQKAASRHNCWICGMIPSQFRSPIKNVTLFVKRWSSWTIIIMLPVCFLLWSEISQKQDIFYKKTTDTMVREWEDNLTIIVSVCLFGIIHNRFNGNDYLM